MRKAQFPILVLALLTLVFSGACKKDDPEPPDDGVIEITADINAVTTWLGDKVYVIRKWDFYVNSTLTIEPGCIIKFHPSDGPDMTLGGSGTIVANGTSTAPIIFTSYKDDGHGGDTNGDGTATSPARRDWGSVDLNGLNGSAFSNCQFYYGGNSTYSGTLVLSAGSIANVSECLFVHNDGSDASGWYGALDASSAGGGTQIVDNIFWDNIRPLSANTLFSINASNSFHNPNDLSEKNTYNGIMMNTGNDVNSAISWEETEVAFVVDDNDFWINTGGSLTLANDVVIKMRPGSGWVLAEGTASIPNFNGSGVYFTSYKDDSHRGDTNGDGSATSPAANDWGGIYDNTLSIPSPYFYTWSNILYDSY